MEMVIYASESKDLKNKFEKILDFEIKSDIKRKNTKNVQYYNIKQLGPINFVFVWIRVTLYHL